MKQQTILCLVTQMSAGKDEKKNQAYEIEIVNG